MLELKNITKDYESGDSVVHALRNVSVSFRRNEFVSILGPSGCGKTTLLNIIGGLDRYTEGDLIINGTSTKKYRDRNWDSYRNHTVGFVFQSYNLIPHQSVLSNVELALTLSGVSKKERRRRAKEVLERVGLGDQLHKRPNQLSGGQMQRVAIARALVNDPSILLADEPTGALDSETSIQIMELLKEVAKDRLVIMVTHNPDLAEQYSTRIIRLLDGRIEGDTMPCKAESKTGKAETKQEKTSMSFLTALSLSFKNLMTKKTRTILISFAGSIGIIGIALILSMSNGAQNMINRMESETLSSYPIMLEKTTVDLSSMLSMQADTKEQIEHDDEHIYSVNVMSTMIDTMIQGSKVNNLADFKTFIESGESGLEELTSDITYSYSTPLNIYRTENGLQKVNPNTLIMDVMPGTNSADVSQMPMNGMGGMTMDVWTQLSSNDQVLDSLYEVVDGHMPEAYNEVVLIVDEENSVTDYTLYSLGLLDPNELKNALSAAAVGEAAELDTQTHIYSLDEIIGVKFKLLVNTDLFVKDGSIWVDKSEDSAYLTSILNASEDITIVGIVRPAADATATAASGLIGYRADLMTHLINKVNTSQIVLEQKANPEVDVFTGLPFQTPDTVYTMEDLMAFIATQPETQQTELMGYVEQMRAAGADDATIAKQIMSSAMANSASYQDNLTRMGVADLNDPSGINLYPIDFEAKDKIAAIIDDYNAKLPEESRLSYTDYIGLMISSITTIINTVSYILIAFVAVSLIVSSIMIGIITYISVLERTREIGVLRSIGASKRDISRVFNAETLTIGFAAGIFGIGITLFFVWIVNLIIESLSGLANVATLPTAGAVLLVAISMILTFIAGLIPSRIASKKDPVVALRTE